ncbi:MAG TPA: hypothetical protein VKT32_02930, partial [Chthonomonadaceae bacterium]|nr:hypothetical protein [Chthonomonadaceae bacterium]
MPFRTGRAALAVLAAFLLLAAGAASAQLSLPRPAPILGARMPALSPDGKRLAFVYRGDIWVCDAGGGHAAALTRNVEMDAYPQFSPDGNWISFSSTRSGNWDIYVIPATGGEVARLTWHSGGDISYGWSPDGKSLIFSASRDTGDDELLTLDVKTLRLHKLAQDYNNMNYASYSPDGKTVVFGHDGEFPWTRPRYHGSGAAQIMLLDTATSKTRPITSDQRQHFWTRFLPDGKRLITVTYGEETPSSHKINAKLVKFVDNPQRTPNLWEFDLDGHGRQITHFTGGSVRFPTVAAKTGDIVFEYDTDLWRLKAGAKTPEKLTLYASEDETQNTFRHETLTSGVTEAEPSPDGKLFAFGLHGDIWTIAVEKPKDAVAKKEAEIARRLTDWIGNDYDFSWSSDGKTLYYRSDREYTTGLYALDVATLKTRSLWNRPEDVDTLHLSPDGTELAFWVRGAQGGLYQVTLADGSIRRLIALPDAARAWQSGGDVEWSPDMQWIAFTTGEMNGAWNLWIMPAKGGEPVNVTRLNAWHGMPAWTPDGKYLLFSSNRDGSGLYALPLTKEQARIAETDIAFEKPKGPVKVAIDFDDITSRIRKLTGQSPEGDLKVTTEGLIVFLSEGDIWSSSYDGSEVKRLTTGGGGESLRPAKDGKKLYFRRNGDLQVMKLESGNPVDK